MQLCRLKAAHTTSSSTTDATVIARQCCEKACGEPFFTEEEHRALLWPYALSNAGRETFKAAYLLVDLAPRWQAGTKTAPVARIAR
jgi:hypothetical protein